MLSQIVSKLYDLEAVKKGKFTLKSGIQSDTYIDMRSVISTPSLLIDISYQLGKLLGKLSDSTENKTLCGVPLGGLPYAVCMSTIYNIPSILLRDKQKKYGMKNIIEGLQNNQNSEINCILVEDIITTGSSILSSIKKLEDNGINISNILVIVDREEGGFNLIKNMGYDIQSLFKLSDLSINNTIIYNNDTYDLKLSLLEISEQKKSNIILSADLDSFEKILRLVDLIGEHIVGVKLHLDTLEKSIYRYHDFKYELSRIKSKHKFIVIEDRKFADIGSITKKQLDLVKDIADVVTAHSITGPDMLEVISYNNIGILPVLQLSSYGNTIDRVCINKTIDYTENLHNLLGYIAQERIIPNQLIFTPGININATQDNMGQRYKTPENTESDFYIIGRGIYQSENPLETVIEYKNRCWKD